MEIKVKYDVGDTVYYEDCDCNIIEGVIRSVEYYKNDNGEILEYNLESSTYPFAENELFKTKEELSNRL